MDPRGVFVSLSHVCPTAASLLFADCDDPFALVSEGPLLTPDLRWEGLDARDALPPQLSARGAVGLARARPMGERRATRPRARFARECPARAPDRRGAAGRLAAIRRPGARGRGRTRDRRRARGRGGRGRTRDRTAGLARTAVGAGWVGGPAGSGTSRRAIDRDLVVSGWRALDQAVGRFLAARAIANWTGYHAASARPWVRSLEAAYAVLRVECARQSAASNRPLDRALFTAAAADADRLLVHRVDAAILARHVNLHGARHP